jgi:hypothetical protein
MKDMCDQVMRELMRVVLVICEQRETNRGDNREDAGEGIEGIHATFDNKNLIFYKISVPLLQRVF